MDAMVFTKDSCGKICMHRKVWGIVTQRGTTSNPLPLGMSKHFESLMFNARADTLYQKPTFGRLAMSGRSCLIAVDGYFEWKAGPGGKHKQPYFVHRQQTKNKTHGEKDNGSSTTTRPYLLMAGLWNQVPTGREDAPTLDTFTIITTEVCQPIQWLHSRMPVLCENEKIALEWLIQPTERIHRLLEEATRQITPGILEAYPVTTSMSSTKFRSADAIKRLQTNQPSVKDLFAQMNAKAAKQRKEGDVSSLKPIRSVSETGSAATQPSLKRPTEKLASSPSLKKRTKASGSPKKKSPPVKNNTKIDSFFQPKHKTKTYDE
jgi:putative SOS response-associated peptidase YedK